MNVGCDFPFRVALVRAGRNEVVIENGGATTITIFGFELAVWSVAKTS